jgi:predicted nucleic acid-binding protein
MPARRTRFGLDSSCLIALLSDWHIQHRKTLNSYEQLLAKGAHAVIPAHALLECFSVLTRLPAPYRVQPEAAKLALRESFSRSALIAEMSPAEVWSAIDSVSLLGPGGGLVYDAVIAQCAAKAGATVLLTWNAKHFLRIAPAGLEVREP